MKNILPYLIIAGILYFIIDKGMKIKKSPTDDSPDTVPEQSSLKSKPLIQIPNIPNRSV